MKKRRKWKLWQKIVSGMICVVVFCTTYALILPAITEETDTFCGYEEHAHTEECWQTETTPELICLIPEAQPHVHGEGCFLPAHAHGEDCWQAEEPVLLCDVPETAGHAHGDACYLSQTPIICGQEEAEAHFHSEACFSAPTAELVCGMEESEEHTHDEMCYSVTEGELVCTLAETDGHTHGPECCGETVETLVCAEEETEGHTHADSCYTTGEAVLICTLEERGENELVCTMEETEGHAHVDSCYTEALEATDVLICQMEEHTHTLSCCSDPTADVESAAVWERTFADAELTGIWRDDLLAIARSQMGYQESTRNYIVLDDGTTMKGYTRYGDWYGDHYGDWCAMFVSFCLHYAGVEDMPLESGCQRWIEALSAEDVALYHPEAAYQPLPGDLIFFNHDQYEDSDHVGLVYELYTADDGTARIRTIEGNTGDCVRFETYAIDDETIMGYAALPEQIVEAEPMDLIETTLTAAIYTDGTYEVTAEDTTVITVSGLLPADAVVKAFPVVIENELNILCAYDIAIILPDGTVYEPAAENPLDVHFQGGIVEQTTEDIQVYHIPEEGEPEPVDTVVTDDGVSFEAPHFSVYALTVSGTMNTVYLNGASGSDTAAGTQNAPVKTFARACELLAPGGTLYISGTVTVSDTQEWSLGNASVRRASSFTGPLITVANGASLDLSDITIHGNSGTPSSSNIATNTSYASNSAKAPLIVVQSGGSLAIHDGTVLTNNSNKPDTSSNIFKENGYVGLGGAVYCNGSLTMDGGTIQYCEAQSGGGIYVENGTFDLSGGLIDHNYARDITPTSSRRSKYHQNAGGGVYVGDDSTMNMSGGTISNNQSSREGGGISLGWLNRGNGAAISEFITTFNMTGGTIDGNIATSTGGGLNITAGRQAFISAGTFTNNRAEGKDYQPGDSTSGSYWEVYSGGAIYLDAQQYDSSGRPSGKPGYAVINRVLITDNEAYYYGGGIATCSTSNSSVNASVSLQNGTAIYNNTASSGNEMHLSGTVNGISDTVLGGGSYNWSKSGSSYDNSLTDESSAIVNAKKLATVIISGNYGYDGGGIGCNGTIEIGGDNDTTSISITKTWENVDGLELPAYIEVQVYRDGVAYGDPIRIYRAANGTWPTYYLDGLETGYTYTVKEVTVPGFTSTVTQNGNNFTITNTRELINVSVEKLWVGDADGAYPAIQVQLLADGDPYGDPVTLSADSNWYHRWEKLPKYNENNAEIDYQIQELNVSDYDVTIEKTEQTLDGTAYSVWESVQSLESGKQYLLVSSSGALAASGNYNLKWADVSADLQAGTTPDSTALWTYSNQNLKNGNGKYLYLSYSTIMLSSNKSTVSFTGGNLLVGSRYFTGISSSYGTSSTNSSGATAFTAYTLTTKTTDPTTSTHFIVTNTRKPASVDVNFGKYVFDSVEDPTPLAGAELALYQLDGESQTLIPGTDEYGTLISQWTSENLHAASGGIHTLTLFDGTYYLVETQAPSGYIGLTGPIIFEVNASDETVTMIEYPGYQVSLPSGDTIDFPVYNAAAYNLPETGGIGTTPYTTAGLLTMAGSLILLSRTRRKKGKYSAA